MKNKIVLVSILALFMFVSFDGYSQVKDPRKKIKSETNNRVNKNIDRSIDKTFDKVENGIKSLFKKKNRKKKDKKDKKKNKENNVSQESQSKNSETTSSDKQKVKATPKVTWAKFDFVPGDNVIFEDAPAHDEENGEFPSRWDLVKGNAEIAEVDGENIIMFFGNSGGRIIPYLKNSDKDYLPEIFTIEMDIWFEKRQSTSNRYYISFRDEKNQYRSSDFRDYLIIYPNGIEFLNTDIRYPGTENNNWSEEPIGQWRHISIAYTKGKFKAYMDDTRLINVPHLEKNPTGLTIRGMWDKMYIKNIRIAKGGVKYYDRMLQDGKIICTGIKFDINKTTLKPESMGPINKVFELMEKNPEINFSVEGHTDSDGDNDFNKTLSEKRAEAVKATLIDLGISADRLSSKGWGETKPNDTNNTAEGKANNRRVEFVKK